MYPKHDDIVDAEADEEEDSFRREIVQHFPTLFDIHAANLQMSGMMIVQYYGVIDHLSQILYHRKLTVIKLLYCMIMTVTSGKLVFLDEILQTLQWDNNSKIVIVSNFTATLDVIARVCELRDWKYLRLDGSTVSSKRQELVQRFNEKHNTTERVFLLSSRAGGVGLNLIGANRLVLFDPDWNPANDAYEHAFIAISIPISIPIPIVLPFCQIIAHTVSYFVLCSQAMARIWRDGQMSECTIYRLLCVGGMDEKIFQRQLTKQEVRRPPIFGRFSPHYNLIIAYDCVSHLLIYLYNIYLYILYVCLYLCLSSSPQSSIKVQQEISVSVAMN